MRIFITGGTGFIGTHLVKKLQEKGHSLCLLSSDLAEPDKWKKEIEEFRPDACVHLAWEGLPDYKPEKSTINIHYAIQEIDFGTTLFDFLVQMGCKNILSVGSTWEHRGRFPEKVVEGIVPEIEYVIEGIESTAIAKIKPADTFSAAKLMINLWGTAVVEEKNRELDNKDKSKFIWARIFFVYGPGQRETSLIPYLINCWKKREIPEIKNPLAQNDYIYIDDVTEAICLLLEKCKEAGDYEIGSGKLISNQEVINVVAKKLNISSWSRDIQDNNTPPYSRPAFIKKIKTAVGWEPKINLEEGIQKMIDYYL